MTHPFCHLLNSGGLSIKKIGIFYLLFASLFCMYVRILISCLCFGESWFKKKKCSNDAVIVFIALSNT